MRFLYFYRFHRNPAKFLWAFVEIDFEIHYFGISDDFHLNVRACAGVGNFISKLTAIQNLFTVQFDDHVSTLQTPTIGWSISHNTCN